MAQLDKEANKPFVFKSAYYLSLYTKVRARNLRELVDGIKKADAGALFHHVFHTVFAKHRLHPYYTNDFAAWVGEELNDEDLAIELSSISGAEPATVEDIRKELLAVLEPRADERPARREFVFVSMVPIVYETGLKARTLAEFLDAVGAAPAESVAYHFVTRRVLDGTGRNDFSTWLEAEFGLSEAAAALSRIDPLIFNNEEELKSEVIRVLERELL
ncbi:MAG: DUF5752 family protein [Thermoproteus sp.]